MDGNRDYLEFVSKEPAEILRRPGGSRVEARSAKLRDINGAPGTWQCLAGKGGNFVALDGDH
jgi:hypothetical protein